MPFAIGLRLDKASLDGSGVLRVDDGDDLSRRQVYGSFKAERVLLFTVKAMAMAELGEREAWLDFYTSMLAVFHREPCNEGYTGPSVEDLKACEKTSLKEVFRL